MASQANGCDGAGNCYVRAGATGTGTGSDWTSAYTGFGTAAGQVNPSAMKRGVTYYVAGGNYSIGSIITLATPDSGTSLITIQAPTIASHGTNTGWSNSYQAQAVFSSIYIESDYWVINGAYRGSGTGLPATDWRTGYGFKVNNNNGSNAPIGSSAVWLGPNTYPSADNTVIHYVEIAGSGDTSGTYIDPALIADQCDNCDIQYNYMHDTGGGTAGLFATKASGTNNMIFKYNWLMNDQSTPANHGEGIAIKGGSGEAWNLTFAFNYLENMEGTGYIGTPDCSGCTGSWYFYGNVFFANLSEWHGNTNPQNGLSYAYIQYFGSSGNPLNMTTVTFWNNTIYQLAPGKSGSGNSCSGLQAGFANVTNFYFQNNLIVNCDASTLSAPTSGTLIRDHNSYFSVTSVSDSGTRLQNVSGIIPFTDASKDDFTLSLDTAAWTAFNSPYNIDLLGKTRNSSRGTVQFFGGTLGPAPPTGLAAIVK
jgi:hypothetical protein